MSEAEPELGIGFIRAIDGMAIDVEYPAVGTSRRYNQRTAPLRRLEFRVGDIIHPQEGEPFEVLRIESRMGINWYHGKTKKQQIPETLISTQHKLQRPLERFLAGQIDPLRAFELRRQTLKLRDRVLHSPVRGLIGPRVMLLPHQAYVVGQVSGRGVPRALLADEVGLGKTIEAGWILHQLLVTERVRRVLLLVPQALVNQWFVEMLRRFNLAFWVPESQTEEPVAGEDLEEHERFIIAMESLEDPDFVESILQIEWDMVVVDEAHRVTWMEGDPSPEYTVLEQLSQKTHGMLLLTATPEQLGLEGHFARLRLVDPQRFPTWAAYQKEHSQYRKVVELADTLSSEKTPSKKEVGALQKLLDGKVDASLFEALDKPENRRQILLSLVDYYGTGRIYFRNSRRVVQLEDFSFPKRKLVTHELQAQAEVDGAAPKKDSERKEDALVPWLAGFLNSHPHDKVLLISTTPKQVIRLKERLLAEYAIKAVEFHEDQALLARDRNAAYFEDPHGARVLLSSEIGGEGRNFQHARHLILADLPLEPDILEQRIGRLDRIGQRNDIQLHVPFLPESREELLLRWYRDVFHAFEAPANGASDVHERFFERIEKFIIKPKLAFTTGKKEFEAVAKEAKDEYESALKVIEAGRDRLIEINSFDPEAGTQLTKAITQAESAEELKAFLEGMFDCMGIHAEPFDRDCLFAEPGDSMFSSYFPALPNEGMRMSFSRSKALKRDDLTLMSWDHPMVTGTLESVLAQEFGNVSVSSWGTKPKGCPPLLIEAYFLLECVADSHWYPDAYFPTQPIRVVMDAKSGKVVTDEWPAEKMHPHLVPVTQEQLQAVRQLPAAPLRALLEKATASAEKDRQSIVSESLRKMQNEVASELSRLKMLQGKNRLVSDVEINWWERRGAKLTESFDRARLRLDSFLLILSAP
jgi:ATP-dependent helicase HepA